MAFKALLTTKTEGVVSTSLVDFDEADLMPGIRGNWRITGAWPLIAIASL